MSIRLTPPPEREFPAERLRQRQEQLVSYVDSAAVRHVVRRPRRVLVAAVAVAAAGVLAAAAYAGYALTRPATQLASIGCYESDSLDANTAVLSSANASPVAACATTYSSAFPGAQRPGSFVACVLPSGSVGVFPGDGAASDTCRSLGLPGLAQTPSSRQQWQRFADLERRLDGVFGGSSCVGSDEARTRVRAALVDTGLSTWKIEIGEGSNGEGFSSQRPCAGLAYDTAGQTVVLVPEGAP